jgi:dethiobiotin synthetase
MTGRLVVVTGTGTEIGKTHLSEALLRALAGAGRVAGVKPVESGVVDGHETDAFRLRRASTFHVKHPAYAFAAPLSPHLAARNAGIAIDVDTLAEELTPLRDVADVVLVELAGGLFSPLADRRTNADLARALRPDFVVLVCPDRLGVLHDVTAALRAAASVPLSIDATIVMAPAVADSSTGLNARELADVVRAPGVIAVPRGSVVELAGSPVIQGLARDVLSRST